jgi:uncharacterized protein (DUF433 family)
MAQTKQYVRTDEHGVMRVGATRVMLDSVIAAFDQGYAPESIRAEYPSLSLEDVYGAIAFCLSNPEEIAEYLRRQDLVWARERARAEQTPSPVVERLRAMKTSHATTERS